MPVSSDKMKVLFDAVSSSYDIGTIDEFKTKMQDPAKRKAFYDGIGQEYDLGESLDVFEGKLGFKKKDGGVSSVAQPEVGGAVSTEPQPSALPSVSTEPPKKLTYSDINAKIEEVSKLQKQKKDATWDSESEYKSLAVQEQEMAAIQKRLDIATKEKNEVLTQYSKEISRAVESLVERGEYKNFFTETGVFDYGKAKQYFTDFSKKYGGGGALIEHWVAGLKARGEGEMERAGVEPIYKQTLKSMGLEKYADPTKYAQSVYQSVATKNQSQIDLVVKDRERKAESLLNSTKSQVDALTQQFNQSVSKLNDAINSGQMWPTPAKEEYDRQREAYEKALADIDRQYRNGVSSINKQSLEKYGRIKAEVDKVAADPEFVMSSIPEQDRKKIDQAYQQARAKYLSGKESVRKAVGESGGITSMTGLGLASSFMNAIASYGDALSSNGYQGKLVDWMQSKRTSAEELKPAQYEWSKDPLKRAVISAAQSMGGSLPTMAASVGIMAATRGTAAGVVASALTSYFGENTQNSGQVYRDVLERTGDVSLARKSADDYMRLVGKTLPLYVAGANSDKLIVLGKGVKSLVKGFALELAEEAPVETVQSRSEAVVTRGYKGSDIQYGMENPELYLDIAAGVIGQSSAMKVFGSALRGIGKNVPASGTQTFADAIMNHGEAFAIRLAQTQFDQGIITEAERDELFSSIKTISGNLAKLDGLGVRGDAAKLHIAMAKDLESLRQERAQEKDESIQSVLDDKIKKKVEAMSGILTGKAEFIVFGLPGDVNSKTMLAEDFNALSVDEQEQMIRNSKTITAVNNDQLNTQLQDRKLALGNPEGAPDGAYNEDATVQSTIQQQEGRPEGGVQERPGVDGGQQEVGQGAGQQGQAPVEVADTGDRVRQGEGLIISDLLDKRITINGQPAILYKEPDSTSIVARVVGTNRIIELGNESEVASMPASTFRIETEQNVVSMSRSGNVVVRGTEYVNNYTDPLAAINTNEDGEIVSVTLDTVDGKKRTFRGQVAEDIAYQIQLKNISEDATASAEFEQFLESEAAAEIAAAETASATETQAAGTDQKVSREKAERVAPPVAPRVEPAPVTPAPTVAAEPQPTAAAQPTEREAALAGELGRELRTEYMPIVEKAAQALSASKVQFEVLDDAEFTSRTGQSAEGAFISTDKEGKILLNRQKMEEADPGVIIWHEASHPVMNIMRNTNKPLYDRVSSGLKQLATKNQKLADALQFGGQYADAIRKNGGTEEEALATAEDESVVEAIAQIAADDKLLASLPVSLKQSMIDFVNYVAKALGIKARISDTDAATFKRVAGEVAAALKEGRDISSIVGKENVGEIHPALAGGITDLNGNLTDISTAQFKLSGFKAMLSKIEFKYFAQSEKYDELKRQKFITEDKTIDDFANVKAMLHVPDHAFTGEMVKDNETIVEGKGGVFYPLRFHDLGYFWASTKTAASSMANKLNEMRRLSPDKKIRLILLTAPEDKLMSSTAASSSMLDVLLSKAFDKRAKITKDQVVASYISGIEKLKNEARTKGKKGVKFEGEVEDFIKTLPSVRASNSSEVFKSKMRSWFAADVSNFDQRKKLNGFVLQSMAEIITDPDGKAQVLEFLSEISGESIRSTGGRLSKANLMSGFSKLFSEPMLKGAAETGDAYAIIELDADVEAVPSAEHESYPFAIKSKDPDKKAVVHVLKKRRPWTDFAVDPETNEIVTEDRQDNVLPPSAGITNILDIRPRSVQLSIGGRPKVGQINWEKSPEGKGDPTISSRNPIVVKAAQDLKNGVISNEEYRATVSENSPIGPITRFFEPATLDEMRRSVSSDKVPRIDNPVADGTVVGLRLDIPAYKNNNTWVVSVHEGRKETGESISYTNVAKINNVDFVPKPKGALNIAAGKEKVSTIRMFGTWENIPGANAKERGENAKRVVQEIADNPDYVQVGMNPFRHSYFYDRNDQIGRPIKSADEVIQVGGLVYAKNPVYGEWTDEAYKVAGLMDSTGRNVQFSIGNRSSIIKSLSRLDPAIKQGLKKMSEPSAVTAGDGSMLFRMPDGSYSDGNDTYDSWDILRQVGEDNRLDLRQSTPEEMANMRYEDKYIFDNILEEIENEILQREFDNKMEVWNFFNDEGLKRFGYDSPMDMTDEDRQIHAALIKKGVQEFENQELSTLADAYELIGKSVDESIADAYLKARADGTNQEFVNQVEVAIGGQFSAYQRPESRREFKLVSFVLRKKAEGYTDAQIAFAINSALPNLTPQEVLSILNNPMQYMMNAFPGMTPMQYANLYRRAQVANIYRPRGFTPQVSQAFAAMGVSQDVLDRYYFKAKTKRQALEETIKSIFVKGFDPSKGLPKWIMQSKEFARGARNRELAQAKKTLDLLAAAAKRIKFDDWGLFALAMNGYGTAINNNSLGLAPFAPNYGASLAGLTLTSQAPASNPVLSRLPLEIQPFVKRMRDQIDALSRKLIVGGFVNPATAVAIEKNLGQYLTRAYRLFNEKDFQPPVSVRNAAIDYLANEEYQRLLQEFYDANTPAQPASTTTGIGPVMSNVGGVANIPYADLMEQATKAAERRVNDILARKDNPYFGSGSIESRDTGILKAKKFIPATIRELMGEYTDPGVTFMMTITKQASLAASSQFLRDMREQGLGTLFFEKNDPNRPGDFNIQIAGPGSSSLEPLNGLYTSEEIYEALQDAEVTRNQAIRLWMQIVGFNRWGKTVGSIRTQFVNFLSNLGFAVMNGLIFTKEGRPFSRAMGEAGKYYAGEWSDKEILDITNKAISLGLVGQSIDANAIKQAFQKGDMFEMALDVALTDKGIFDKTSKKVRPVSFFNKLYRLGDDFWKVYGYVSERSQIARLRFGGEYETLTQEQQDKVDREASDRVKDTWPTYDRMWGAVRKLSQEVPILGDFTAFQAESLRVLINAGKIMNKDMKDPQMRVAGMRRAGGMLAYVGIRTAVTTAVPMMLNYGVSGVLGALLNDDDEEDRKWALKEVAPFFMRTGDILAHQNKDKPHMYTVVDMLSVDPLNITARSLNALTEGNQNFDPGFKATLAQLVGGFIGPEMTFSGAVGLAMNYDMRTKQKIYSEEDSDIEATQKIVKYVYKTMEPSTLGLIGRVMNNENKAAEAAAFAGFRPYEIDLHKSFNISLAKTKESFNEISKEYMAIKFDDKKTDEEKEQARLRAGEKKAAVVAKYHRLYSTLIKLGANQEVMEDIVRNMSAIKMTGMDGKTKNAIIDGEIDPESFY